MKFPTSGAIALIFVAATTAAASAQSRTGSGTIWTDTRAGDARRQGDADSDRRGSRMDDGDSDSDSDSDRNGIKKVKKAKKHKKAKNGDRVGTIERIEQIGRSRRDTSAAARTAGSVVDIIIGRRQR